MSRAKSRTQPEVCGDCGSTEPTWASINRGILLCADCCSVHRSLGRHISQVKSLRHGQWSSSVLNFVNQLNAHGANSVWEHLLMDSVAPKNLKRKPSPKDPIHPAKVEFIRAKHVNLSYVLKPSSQQTDDASANLEIELSKQLHASVRSSNLETSLRLLIQGADPNYFHDEKGSTALHVAAKSGQASQIELLLVYGADINALDVNKNNVVEIARSNKHIAIADRLVEAMYEVTDHISHFLLGRKPDHANGKHLLIPEYANKDISEQLKIARGKLQLVPNRMFEELVMDLYDEIDRRETEAIWAICTTNPEIGAVPFLPTNPHLSATRNQGRQKLARFSRQEFQGLLTDVLIDAKRRQNLANLKPINSILPAINVQQLKATRDCASNLSDDEPLYDAVASDDDYAALAPVAQQAVVNRSPLSTVSTAEVDALKKQLQDSESQINELKTLVLRLTSENSQLKSKIDSIDFEAQASSEDASEMEPVLDSRQAGYSKRPVSMYEARQMAKDDVNRPPVTQSLYSIATNQPQVSVIETVLPLFEEVKKRTDMVARRIKELYTAMQDLAKKDSFIPCAERIRVAVAELLAIFPPNVADEPIRNALKQINYNTNLIQADCTRLQRALIGHAEDGGPSSLDSANSTEYHIKKVRDCAYDLAMSTKVLITHFEGQE